MNLFNILYTQLLSGTKWVDWWSSPVLLSIRGCAKLIWRPVSWTFSICRSPTGSWRPSRWLSFKWRFLSRSISLTDKITSGHRKHFTHWAGVFLYTVGKDPASTPCFSHLISQWVGLQPSTLHAVSVLRLTKCASLRCTPAQVNIPLSIHKEIRNKSPGAELWRLCSG